MARLARLHAPGIPHYVVQRAAPGRTVFADDDDYRHFVALLADAVREHGVALHAYALVPDEVRLLATPPDAASLSRLVQAIGRRYVPFVNRRGGRDGPLWRGRFRSTLIDPDAFLIAAMLHVEQRPRALGVVPDGGGWHWSSERHHAGEEQQSFVVDHARYWSLSNTPFERQALYREALATLQPPALAARIDQAVDRGWALGDAAFVDAISASATRRATPRRPGRPRSIRP